RGDKRGIVALDPRTPAGRRLAHVRRAILQELGPNITRRKRLLVEDVVLCQHRINLFNEKMISGEFSEYDDTVYLSYVANKRRQLQTWGLGPRLADLMDKK